MLLMNSGLKIALVCCTLVCVGVARKIPPYVKVCSRNDPNLNACVLTSGRAALKSGLITTGDRKYNIPVLDPLQIQELIVEQQGVAIRHTDMAITGIKGVQLIDARVDMKKRHQEFDLVIPLVELKANYKIAGRILVLPIAGNGTANVTLKDVKVTLKLDFDLVQKKKSGPFYLEIKNTTFITRPSQGTVYLDGLFNGDKRLGDNMNRFLNENFQDIYTELGPAYDLALAKIADQIYSGLTNMLAYEDLFPETL